MSRCRSWASRLHDRSRTRRRASDEERQNSHFHPRHPVPPVDATIAPLAAEVKRAGRTRSESNGSRRRVCRRAPTRNARMDDSGSGRSSARSRQCDCYQPGSGGSSVHCDPVNRPGVKSEAYGIEPDRAGFAGAILASLPAQSLQGGARRQARDDRRKGGVSPPPS